MTKKAFSLVELIIAISIVGILTTIGFVSYTNYLPDSRDASRLEALSEIKKSMEIYRIKNQLPIPDNKVDIQVNGLLTSYQGYLSNQILNIVKYSSNGKKRGKDPKDNTYYTYYTSKDLKRFELMGYLENQTKTSYILDSIYAEGINYTNRFSVYYGDQLGIITQSGTNTPIQEVDTFKSQGYINFTGSLSGEYNLGFKNNESFSSSDMILLSNKIKESLKISSVAVVSNETGTGCAGTISDTNGISTATSEVTYINWTKSDTPGTCTWNCKSGYTWNGSNCVNSRTYYCQAKPVIGTEWNTVSSYTQSWNGSSWSPADDPTSEYNITADTNTCRFTCINGYTWNGTNCVANTQTASCTGLPTNALWNTASSITQSWNGSTWIPSTTGVYNETVSTTECRYKCNTNYKWNGTSCVADSRVFVCTNKPSNSTWNTVPGYIQTWNGSAWTPVDDIITEFNISGSNNSCQYICSSGYHLYLGVCVNDICSFDNSGSAFDDCKLQ